MANGLVIADTPAAFQRGLEIRRGIEDRPAQQQVAQLGLQRQQQALVTGGLQQQQAQLGIDQGQQQLTTEKRNQQFKDFVTAAVQIKSVPDEKKLDALINRRNQLINQGSQDTSDTDVGIKLAREGRFDELNQTLDGVIDSGISLGILTAPKAPAQASSGQREFESLTAGLTDEQKQEAVLIKLGISPRAVSSADITIAESKELTDQIANSKAVIGERKKFGELTGSSRAKKIDAGFERIQKINTGIANLEKAIGLIGSGASTGAIERLFPSIKASTVALNNLQSTMALDVIGAVTFGALSQGELDLAKTVALNTRLKGPELIKDLEARKAAQEKLRDYFNQQIQFLDQGGTVAGFLRRQESNAPKQPAGGDLSPAEQAELAELERQLGGQ